VERTRAEEFAIEAYKGWLESMHRSEQIGEKRLEFFLTFATAALGAVLALAKGDGHEIQPEPAVELGKWVLPFLLVVGLLTFFRMLQRDAQTDRCMQQLERTGRWFAKPEEKRYAGDDWEPWKRLEGVQAKPRKIMDGGLTSMMITLNGLLMGLWFGAMFTTITPEGHVIVPFEKIAFGVLIGWFGGWAYRRWGRKMNT
jgi:hypothetical protein